MLNRNFNNFKFQHKKNKHQILYTSRKTQNDREVLNLIDNFLNEKNSFIFESVEKGKIRGRYTIFGKNPDKIWEFNKKILDSISEGKFNQVSFDKLNKNTIKKIKLNSVKDNKRFEIDSVKLLGLRLGLESGIGLGCASDWRLIFREKFWYF